MIRRTWEALVLRESFMGTVGFSATCEGCCLAFGSPGSRPWGKYSRQHLQGVEKRDEEEKGTQRGQVPTCPTGAQPNEEHLESGDSFSSTFQNAFQLRGQKAGVLSSNCHFVGGLFPWAVTLQYMPVVPVVLAPGTGVVKDSFSMDEDKWVRAVHSRVHAALRI